MTAFRTVALISATLLVSASLALGLAPPVSDQIIGVVITSVPGGAIQVDGVGVVGNASLTQGSRVQTGDAPASIRLSNGTRATLEQASQARVFADHVLLEKGGTIVSTDGYQVETQGARVAAMVAGTDLAVTSRSPSTIEVGALNGAARVQSSSGALLARVDAGSVVSVHLFESEATGGTAAPSAISGRLVPQANGKFAVTDESNHVTYALSASGAKPSGLASAAGKLVTLTGKSGNLGGGASFNVSSMTVVTATNLSRTSVSALAKGKGWSEAEHDHGGKGDHDDHGDRDDRGDHGDHGDHDGHHHHHPPPVSRP